MGLVEVEFSDSIIRKTIEVLFNGWPQFINRPESRKQKTSSLSVKTQQRTTIKADMEGLVIRMRVKKEVSTLKVLVLKISQTNDASNNEDSLKVSLDDFQIMH